MNFISVVILLYFLQSEKLMRQMSEPWEERLQRSEQASQERQAALEKMGISVQQSGISVRDLKHFFIFNLLKLKQKTLYRWRPIDFTWSI
jgi:hypothetical protein